jgi:hypothetical protein
MNMEQAKQISLVDLLERLGYKGEQKGKNYWLNSPLNGERTPSFKVNTAKNLWTDWSGGEKKTGNIIAFGMAYWQTDESGVLAQLDSIYRGMSYTKMPQIKKEDFKPDEPEIIIQAIKTLQSFPLLNYAKERKITPAIAQQFCKEVHYQVKDKNYYAIGFKNDSGGYALRNKYVKQATMPNDLTFLNNGAKELALFEGFFDFLSYKQMFAQQGSPKMNFLILNSTSFFEKSLPILQAHDRVYGYGQNDEAGNKIMTRAKATLQEKWIDQRSLYKDYKDLNDWLMHFGMVQKQHNRQQL